MNKLTALQENAAKLFVEGNTQSDAYRLAGYKVDKCTDKTINEAASRMFADSKVSARVKELQAIHTKKHMFTVDKAHKQYIAAYDMAEDKEKPETMISATRAQCDLHGIEAPKKINLEGSLGEWLSSLQGAK